ncbi:MAG TPA: ABC transporter substrate-binding protein [Trueperaceae bacterium]|jgi:peptide/nickel transport system substrate-binding protein
MGQRSTLLRKVLTVLLVLGGASTGALAQQTLSFTLDTTENRAPEAQAIAAMLAEIGVDAQVRVWQSAVLVEEMQAGNRSASTGDWGSAYFDPFDLGIPKFGTQARGNRSFYSNPDVDEAFRIASTTLDDEARRQAYFDAQRMIFEDAPWIFGYVLENIEAASDAVQGWQPAADNSESMHEVSVQGSDTLVVGMRTDNLLTFDPAMYRSRDTEAVLRNIFDSLVGATPEGQVVPMLAREWRAVDDTTFEFDLVEGVTFSNGEPLTAEDVVFTFERIITEGGVDGQTSPRAGLLGPIDSVEAVDDHTVRFHYRETFPQGLLEQALVHFQIVPKDYMEEVGVAGFTQQPIGSGPFVYVGGSLDSQVTLQRNESYWQGPPPLQTLVFRMMPEPSTRVAALLSGEVQIIQEVPGDLVDRIDSAPGVSVHTAPGTRAYFIELNVSKPPFDDVRVRQALNYAIDWENILENIYRGRGQRLSTGFLPSGFGYDPDLQPYPYDPDRARELLREAGYAVR